MGISLQFVKEMLLVVQENVTTRPAASHDALRVLISMVTTPLDNIETRDNGNIIILEFLKMNTTNAIEAPFIPMAFEGFTTVQTNLKDDNSKIESHLRALRELAEHREQIAKQSQNRRRLQMGGDDEESDDDEGSE